MTLWRILPEISQDDFLVSTENLLGFEEKFVQYFLQLFLLWICFEIPPDITNRFLWKILQVFLHKIFQWFFRKILQQLHKKNVFIRIQTIEIFPICFSEILQSFYFHNFFQGIFPVVPSEILVWFFQVVMIPEINPVNVNLNFKRSLLSYLLFFCINYEFVSPDVLQGLLQKYLNVFLPWESPTGSCGNNSRNSYIKYFKACFGKLFQQLHQKFFQGYLKKNASHIFFRIF